MTTYAHDPDASVLVASWPTGDGAVARTIARVSRNWDHGLARRAAGALTRLSTCLWLAYSEDEVAGIRRVAITDAVRRPKQPSGDLLTITEDDCVEAAHLLGRIVSLAPGRAFVDAVLRDVHDEVDAVRRADAGDLTGRARQAVAHVRPEVSNDQLATAHALLHDDPLEPVELLISVEPNAAALAALGWLRAAAGHVAVRVGHPVPDVVALAEAIGHEDLRVTRAAVAPSRRMTDEELVFDLLQEAVLAGRGYFVVCPDRPEQSGTDFGDGPGTDPGTDPGADREDAHRHRVVTTVLDPAEPGRCLVDGLIRGIQGCFRVYADEATTGGRPGAEPPSAGPQRATELRRRFVTEVREAMRTHR